MTPGMFELLVADNLMKVHGENDVSQATDDQPVFLFHTCDFSNQTTFYLHKNMLAERRGPRLSALAAAV